MYYIHITKKSVSHIVGTNRKYNIADCAMKITDEKIMLIERRGSVVELRTLDYEKPGSNPGCGVKTLDKFFHSTLLQFTQLNK